MFDSVGELFAWLEKRGWKPKWHTEPQDSVDFTIQSIQNYLKRLVQGEAAIADQVEARKKQLALAEQMESTGNYSIPDLEEEAMESIEYEEEFDDSAIDD